MSEIRNCPKCGKVFMFTFNPLCPDCIRQEDDDFIKVRNYLREHPDTDKGEVGEATGVSISAISRMVAAGKLENIYKKIDVQCERCGKRIPSGRYCQECIKFLTTSLAKPTSPPGGWSTQRAESRRSGFLVLHAFVFLAFGFSR